MNSYTTNHDTATLLEIENPHELLCLGNPVTVRGNTTNHGQTGTLTGISVHTTADPGHRTCTVTHDDGTDSHVFAQHLTRYAGTPPVWLYLAGDRVQLANGECGTVRNPRSGDRVDVNTDNGNTHTTAARAIIRLVRFHLTVGRDSRTSNVIAYQLKQLYPNAHVIDAGRDHFGNCTITLEVPYVDDITGPPYAGA